MRAALEVEELRKRFEEVTALDGLDLVAAEGDVVALLGPNGAGKTTLVRDPETAQSAGFIWVFPLTFASSAFVPTGSMPDAVRAFADVNPMTLCVNAVRDLMLGGHATGAVLGTLAWLAGLLLIFVPLSVGRYRALE